MIVTFFQLLLYLSYFFDSFLFPCSFFSIIGLVGGLLLALFCGDWEFFAVYFLLSILYFSYYFLGLTGG